MRIEVEADGYEPTFQDVSLSIQSAQICCSSCSTSQERCEIELTPAAS